MKSIINLVFIMLSSVKEVKTTCDIITQNNYITTSGNNVTVTWTLPGESETFTYLEFHSPGRTMKHKCVAPPLSSCTITLTSCTKYRLEIQCTYSNSGRSVLSYSYYLNMDRFAHLNSTHIPFSLSTCSTCIALLLSFSSKCNTCRVSSNKAMHVELVVTKQYMLS
jgi:hypothetical protein